MERDGLTTKVLEKLTKDTIREINNDNLPGWKLDYIKAIHYDNCICTNIDWL